jgi:acetyl-CoA acyltransferase
MTTFAGRDAVIVGAVRTPIGKGKASGALYGVHPTDLLAHSLRTLVERTGIDPTDVDDVIAGAVTQAGDQAANIARNALLAAGFPETVPGTTVDRQCGSSQQAINFAAQAVISGAQDIVIAAGVESMSRAPMGSSVLPGTDPFGVAFKQRYSEGLVPQGISAELIAAKWGLSRLQLDEFSATSHEKAAAATKEGRFDHELAPIAGLSTDEIIRPGTTVDTLAALGPAFYNEAYTARFPQINWEITPGNSSPLSDGSAAVLITTSEVARRLGLRPLARILSMTVVGSDPLYMLTGVIPATEKVLRRAGLALSDIDLFEVNEAFAPVVLAWASVENGVPNQRLLERTNVNGGAIAIGHPLGASGARIMTTLVNALHQRGGRYGLQTMCEGGGMANATIIERLS